MGTPFLNTIRDTQSWSPEVARFADAFSVNLKKGEDKRLKMIWATLEKMIYESGLSQAQQSIIERKISNAFVSVKQEYQLQAVKGIVQDLQVYE